MMMLDHGYNFSFGKYISLIQARTNTAENNWHVNCKCALDSDLSQ